MPRTFSIKVASQQDDNVEWVKWTDNVKDVGDSFEIIPERITFKDESGVFYLVSELDGDTRTGTSVFCEHHPASKFTDSMPDGLRLASAIGRYLEIDGDVEAEELVSSINDALPVVVRVERTEKGRLWTVSDSA
jgi:hypothetical protein